MGFAVLIAVGPLALLDNVLCFVEAIGAWTVGFVVLRAVFLLKPLVPGQWVLLF